MQLPLWLLTFGGWLWLFGSMIAWFAEVSQAHSRYRLSLLLFLVMAVVIALRARSALSSTLALPLLKEPRLSYKTLFAFGTTTLLYVVAEHFVQIHTLSALLFGLSTFSLLALHLPRNVARRAVPAALLLSALLPFGAYANTYVGLFFRLFTAEAASRLLQASHIAVVPAQTILVLESGVAHIDIPCSGLASLWTGTLVFLAAAWLSGRAVGLRLFGSFVVFLLSVCAVNVLRVYLIVVLAVTFSLPTVAEVLHEPIGVLGFVFALFAGWLLLHRAPRVQDTATAEEQPQSPRYLGLLLPLFLLLCASVHTVRPSLAEAPPMSVTLPESLSTTRLPLDRAEKALFSRFGAHADKWQLKRGSLLLVSTTSWRAQHPPELCLASAGLKILDMHTVEVAPGFPVRVLSLLSSGKRRTAVYFFQSPTRITAAFYRRVLASLTISDRRWVMASLLLDEEVQDPKSLAPLLLSLSTTIDGSFDGAVSNERGSK